MSSNLVEKLVNDINYKHSWCCRRRTMWSILFTVSQRKIDRAEARRGREKLAWRVEMETVVVYIFLFSAINAGDTKQNPSLTTLYL